MTVKTTGAEWKRFYGDKAVWPEGSHHEDEEIVVDGQPWAWDADMMTIQDSAVLSVAGGIVYTKEHDTDGPSLESYFRRWRKVQNTVFLSCEAPRGSADAVKAAVLAAGGRVHAL